MVTVWWRIRLVGWVIADLHAHAGYSSQRNVRVSCMASWINTSLIWMSFHRGGQASMWWVTLQEKQTKTNMAPTSTLRRTLTNLNCFTSQVASAKNRQKFHISFGWSHRRISSTEPPSKTTIHPYWLQGATKVSFTAYHSGKLELVRTRPKVISNSQKKIFDEQDWLRFFCIWIPPSPPQKKTFNSPSGRLRTAFTSPITKSTRPWLSIGQ